MDVGTGLVNADVEIVVRSLDLDGAANEKTIEVLQTGLINLPKINDAGYLAGLQADDGTCPEP